MNDNLNLLKALCEVDSRWTVQGHPNNNHWGLENDDSEFLELNPDGSIHGGEALYSMLQEMRARGIELKVYERGIAGHPPKEERALSCILPNSWMSASPEMIIKMYIRWKKAAYLSVQNQETK